MEKCQKCKKKVCLIYCRSCSSYYCLECDRLCHNLPKNKKHKRKNITSSLLNFQKSNNNIKINYNNLTNKTDVVLEVKFDRFLEPYLSNLLASYGTRLQSVSKYVMGRNI